MENAAHGDWGVLAGSFPDGWKEEATRSGGWTGPIAIYFSA